MIAEFLQRYQHLELIEGQQMKYPNEFIIYGGFI